MQWVLRRGPSAHLEPGQWPTFVDLWNDLVDETIFAFLRAIDKGHLPLSEMAMKSCLTTPPMRLQMTATLPESVNLAGERQ